MHKTGGENLDAHLLRFRADPASEDAGRLAEQLLSQSRASEALEVLTAKLAGTPDDANVLVTAGRAYLGVGDLLRAQQMLMQAAKLAPDAVAPYRWLGEVLLKRGDPGRAAKVLAKAKAAGGDREVEQLLSRATRLAKLAEDEPAPAGGFGDERPTAKVAVSVPAEVSVPVVAPPPPAPAHAIAEPPKRVPRRPLGTQIGIGQLGALTPPTRPTPPTEEPEPTVVAPDLRAQLKDQLSRRDDEPSVAVGGPPSITAVFDDQPTALLERATATPIVPPSRPIAPRPIAPRPSPSFRPPAHPSAAESEIPESLPPKKSAPPERRVAPAPRGLASERPRPGGAENVDAILSMLEEERIFEPPTGEAAAWADSARVERGGTRVGRMFIGLWVLALLGAAGAYVGFLKFTEREHAEARRLRDEARALGLRADEADLVRAFELLDRADEREPTAPEAAALRLALLAERSLESGGVDRSLVRSALDRAERAHADAALVAAGRAVVAHSEGRADRVVELLGDAAVEASRDAWVLYLRGRLQQRLGREGSGEVLAAALEEEPGMVSAELALVEADASEQRSQEALERLGRVLGREPSHLRAQLWRAFLEADTEDPEASLARVAALAAQLEHAGPSDRALAGLLEARAARREGDTSRAAEAIERAVAESASSPRTLVLLAREAAAIGEHGRAQQAATTALAVSPGDVLARALLAEVQLERGDAREALSTLASLSTEDPEVLRLSARAALALGGPALEAADQAMDAHLSARGAAAAVDMQALSVRMKARRGGASAELLARAEQLTRNAPGDPHALTALSEVALDARDPAKALAALERLVQVAGDRAATHFLLGRARRMAGDATGARDALRRAIELEPGNRAAKIALGYLLLDMGDFEAAEALYQEMARSVTGGASALTVRLGRVESLLGLGRIADAKVQLDGIPQRDAESTDVRVTTARVALAENRAADALGQLRPVAEAEGASADLVALYADALYAAGETEAASVQYTRALEIDSESPEGLVGYAQVLVRGEKNRDAVNILERASRALERRVRPPSLRARMLVLRGRVHLAENDRAAASAALRQATALAGAPADAWFHLGEALSGTNAPEARAAYARYLELAPGGPLAQRAQRAMR